MKKISRERAKKSLLSERRTRGERGLVAAGFFSPEKVGSKRKRSHPFLLFFRSWIERTRPRARSAREVKKSEEEGRGIREDACCSSFSFFFPFDCAWHPRSFFFHSSFSRKEQKRRKRRARVKTVKNAGEDDERRDVLGPWWP